MTEVKLSNGYYMPIVGYGTDEGYGEEVDENRMTQSVIAAIDAGCRHFDTAQLYKTESAVGRGINSAIDQGRVTREELFVSTKLWVTHHQLEDVVINLRKSLRRLNLDYVDLFLMHGPTAMQPSEKDDFPFNEAGKVICADIDILETWKGMEDGCKQGLTRSIGVSNFNKRQIQKIIDNCKIKPVVNQVEANLFFQNRSLIGFCQSINLNVIGFMSLQFFNEDTASKDKVTETVQDIAKLYGKTPQHIALKFWVQQGVAVIPSSHNVDHIKANLQLFDFELSEDDMDRLRALDTNIRAFDFITKDSKEYPFLDPY